MLPISRLKRVAGRLIRGSDGLTPLALKRLFLSRGITPRLFLEVGANDGSDTRRMQRMFPSVVFHCFEPDPRAIQAFKTQIHHPSVVLHEVALGAQVGFVPFYQSSGAPPGRQDDFPEGWHQSGSIRRPTGHLEVYDWCSFDEGLEVTVWTLDSWFAGGHQSVIDFIWADVQGAEIDLVVGGKSALTKTRFFYTEYSDKELYEGQVGLRDLMDALPGWRVHTKFTNDVLLENCNPIA